MPLILSCYGFPTPSSSSGHHREEIMNNITSNFCYFIGKFEQDDDSIEERDEAEYDLDEDNVPQC